LVETSAILNRMTRGETDERPPAFAVNHAAAHPLRVCFIVESGTDVRMSAPRDGLSVLFFVEGFTDIRFVAGLSRICRLTMVVPSQQYAASGLRERVTGLGLDINVLEIGGSRLEFQARSFAWLWRHARRFNLILAQEVLRGALNANIVGKLRGVPVATYMGIAPLEYFRCRRERGQIGAFKAIAGEVVIRCLLDLNGRMATRCLAMGPYLHEVASRYCRRSVIGLYYGVDTGLFRPETCSERADIRQRLKLPSDKFIILFSSRISHEKDPETVLCATEIARKRGLDAIVLNIGGGWREFLGLAESLGLPDSRRWVLGRPAAHPLTEVFDYLRAADAVAQASLAEGAAYSTLEALACGTPVVATAVGGMALQLNGYARLVPRRDAAAMAEQIIWIAANRADAHAQALRGREYVVREWSSEKAFADLSEILKEVAATA
jgi:glycosyltransferase involved in cell wall biosynthesis